VITLLDVCVPQRQSRAIEGRRHLQRNLQVIDRGGWRFREQTFDEVLEDRERRLHALDFVRRFLRRPNLPGDAFEGPKQILERATYGDVGLHASAVERDAPRTNDERVGLQLQRSEDDLGCADELSDADDRRVGERGGGRNLQTLERLLPLLPRDRARAKGVQVVGQQHGRRLPEPEDAALSLQVVERHHENPRRCGRGRRRLSAALNDVARGSRRRDSRL
jgi:hypothetical protein